MWSKGSILQAATAPAAASVAAAVAPATTEAAASASAAPAAAPEQRRGGYRYGSTGQQIGGGGEGGQDPMYAMDWLWDPTLDGSQGYYDTVYDEMGSSQQYVAPPNDPDPLGRLTYRMGSYGGENPTGDDGAGFYDAGSGLRVVDPAAIQRGQLAELHRLTDGLSIEDQVRAIYSNTGDSANILGGHGGLRFALNNNFFPPEVAAQLEPIVAEMERKEADSRGFSSAMNDIYQVGQNHFDGILDSWQEDPERALLGINTPLESEVWGAILGKEYDSNMNMAGAPNEATYERTAAEGYDPRFTRWANNAVGSIAGAMGGMALGGTAFGSTPSGQTAIAGGRGAIDALDRGDDPWRNMLNSALMSIAQSTSMPNGMFGGTPDAPATGGADRMQLADSGAIMSDAGGEQLFSPNSYMNQASFTGSEASLADANVTSPVYGDLADGTTYAPGSFTGYDPTTGQAMFNSTGMLGTELEQEDAQNLETLEAGDAPAPEAAPAETNNLAKYAKVVKSLLDIFGQEEGSNPEGAPTQEDAEDEAHFTEELAQYLSLDPAAMAEAGLEPGSPEYMAYIMEQADAVIAQALEGMDVDAEDFAAQLRGKTEAELLELQRALYVRGQMEQLMGSGTYTDPSTGRSQEVIGQGMFNPNVGAYQQGVAEDVDTLAGLKGQDAMDFLNERIGRRQDMFGMQGKANARLERAKMEEQDELRKRRGMFS
jgi:hypothetical protein